MHGCCRSSNCGVLILLLPHAACPKYTMHHEPVRNCHSWLIPARHRPIHAKRVGGNKGQQHAAVEGFVLRTPPCVACCSKHRPDAPTHAYHTYPPSRRTTQQMMLTHCLCFTCHVHSSQTKEGGINITGTRPHEHMFTCCLGKCNHQRATAAAVPAPHLGSGTAPRSSYSQPKQHMDSSFVVFCLRNRMLLLLSHTTPPATPNPTCQPARHHPAPTHPYATSTRTA